MKSITPVPHEIPVFLPGESVEKVLQRMEKEGFDSGFIKGSHGRYLIRKYLHLALKMGMGSMPAWLFTFRKPSFQIVEREDENLLKTLLRFIPCVEGILEFLMESEERVFLVGGTVRDVLLSIQPKELDLMVEGDAISLGKKLVKKLSGKVKSYHPRFGTVSLEIRNLRVDIARARTDFYPVPGGNPVIKWVKGEEDPWRRDFTVNAIIFEIKRGKLIDVVEGLKDMETKTLSPVTPVSFYEDPTRMQRGIRLAMRLGFELSEDFLLQIEGLKATGFMGNIPAERLLAEDKLLLEEERPSRVIMECIKLGVFEMLFPGLPHPPPVILKKIDSAQREKGVEKLWYLRLLIWLREVPHHRRKEFIKKFKFGKRISNVLSNPEELRNFHPLTKEEKAFLEISSR